MSPDRILYVVNDAPFFLSHRLPVARAAHQAGWEVHVATPPSDAAAVITANGFSFHPISMTRKGTNPPAELRSIASLFRLYRRVRPRLVHHVTMKPVLYGGIAARLARVPGVVGALTGLGHVFTADTAGSAVLRSLMKSGLRAALSHPNQMIILQNPDDRSMLIASNIIAPEETTLIPGSGVDMEVFTPSAEPAGPVLVVLPSRMLWSKGIAEFVDAARMLRDAGSSARFALVGDTDPDNPAAVPTARLADWHGSGVVEWWGYQRDMPAVFRQAHVVCLPSFYGEGVPKSLIEAAASGKPIVSTNAPGCREIVRDGENGLLVPIRDSRALADALESLIASEDLRRRMGARSRDIAVTGFAVERIIAQTLAVYERLLTRI